MHIGIDARLVDGAWGGVQQFVIGLAGGLSTHPDKNAQYTFFMYDGHTSWLEPYLVSSNCQIVSVAKTPDLSTSLKTRIRGQFPFLRNILHQIYYWQKKYPGINDLNAIVDSYNLDLFHFTFQQGERTTLPTIYQPWDLQHCHLPKFFTPYERYTRDVLYKTFCEQAQIVNVASEWTKQDVIQQYGIEASKIEVTPMGSVLDLYPSPTVATMDDVRDRFNLPSQFLFYPAQRWQHKNHIRLLDALAKLRDEHALHIPLVLSGGTNDFDDFVMRHINHHELTEQIINVGYVSQLALTCLYRLATALVFPTQFEGWGLPITEALSVGLPIACSRVTTLPEQVGDAALLFDPLDTAQIAHAIYQLWTDVSLRQRLSEQALVRGQMFTWEQTAASFYEQYYQIARLKGDG